MIRVAIWASFRWWAATYTEQRRDRTPIHILLAQLIYLSTHHPYNNLRAKLFIFNCLYAHKAAFQRSPATTVTSSQFRPFILTPAMPISPDKRPTSTAPNTRLVYTISQR